VTRMLTAGVAAEIEKPVITPVWFVEAQFSGGYVRAWTGMRPILWDGKSWTALGWFLGIGGISDSTNIEAAGLTLTLSGVPSELIAVAYGEFSQGRPCTVWLGFLDAADQLISDPVRASRARMDTIADEDTGETATISVAVENGLIDLGRLNVARYTNEEHQRLFPGDRGLEFIASFQGKQIAWGQAGDSGIPRVNGNGQ
jgi:hypothetical protein